MARAFLFPGPGAQTVGMGKDLADAYPSAKAVFDIAISAGCAFRVSVRSC